jgi:hypothetical protein
MRSRDVVGSMTRTEKSPIKKIIKKFCELSD